MLTCYTTLNAQEGYFKGSVKDEAQQPLFRAKVMVYDKNDELIEQTFTDEMGRFETDILVRNITSIPKELQEDKFALFAYPNPLITGPLRFRYNSVKVRFHRLGYIPLRVNLLKRGLLYSRETMCIKQYLIRAIKM